MSGTIAKASDKQDKGLHDETWVILQIKGFMAWANSHLIKRELEMKSIHDLCADGLLLISLLEILSGRKFSIAYEKKPKSHIEKVVNINACFTFMEKLDVKIMSYSPETCLDTSDPKPKLSILWALIRKYHIVSEDGEGTSGNASDIKKELLKWVQEVTAPYSGVKIENFTSSWKDGMGFCALVNFALPELLDFDSLDEELVEKNLTDAFALANKELEIPTLLHPADVAEGMLDEHVVMTYVSYFRNSAAMQEKRRALQKKLEEERGNTLSMAAKVESLTAQLNDLQHRYDEQCENIEKYQSTNTELENSLNGSRQRIGQLEETLDVTEKEKNHITEVAEELKAYSSKKNDELMNERMKNAEHEAALAALREENSQLQEKLSITNINLAATTNEREQLKSQVAQLQSMMSQSSDENAKQLAEVTAKLHQLELDLQTEKTWHNAAKEKIVNLTTNLENTTNDLSAANKTISDYKTRVADLMLSLQMESDKLALLKASVEMRVLTYPKPKTDIAAIKSRISEISEETKTEESRLINLKAKIEDCNKQVIALSSKTDGNSRQKLEEAELQRRQAEMEFNAFRNLRAVILAELWDAQMKLLASEPKETFELGSEISERMDVVALQLRRAGPAIQELRQVQTELQGELAVQQKDMEMVFALMKGENLLKYNKRGSGKPQKRFFFIHLFREATVFWSEEEASGAVAGGSAATSKNSSLFSFGNGLDFRQGVLVNVHEGPSEDVQKAQGSLSTQIAELSFNLELSDRRLDMIAPSRGVYEQWTSGLRKVLIGFKKGVIGGSAAQMRMDLILSKSLNQEFDYAVEKARLEAEAHKRAGDTKKQLEDIMGNLKKSKSNDASGASGVSGRSRSVSGSIQFKDEVKKVMTRVFVYERVKSSQEYVSVWVNQDDSIDKVLENVCIALNKSVSKQMQPSVLQLSYKVAGVKNIIGKDVKPFQLMKDHHSQVDFTIWVDFK